ncbi:DUF3331 domain-containing protein, partial [Paraburkholderia oxyphila]|uniref:DUF3331 domain-containing protein n=1 Tax=Paraburkholderia oxyphila TaxID=614212 RepID=UPI001C3F1535
LGGEPRCVPGPGHVIASMSPPQAQPFPPPHIEVLERLPRNRIAVSWRQPGRACYGEQIWSPSTASEAGTCALSMVSFEAGAQVFLPAIGEYPPHNRDERILADAISSLDLDCPAKRVRC